MSNAINARKGSRLQSIILVIRGLKKSEGIWELRIFKS